MRYYRLKYTSATKRFKRNPWCGGYAKAFCIWIRPKYEKDNGILEHEKTHVRQFYFTLGFHGLLYLLCKPYRLWAEIQAYRKQLEVYRGEGVCVVKLQTLFAKALCDNYGLDISYKQARAKLA